MLRMLACDMSFDVREVSMAPGADPGGDAIAKARQMTTEGTSGPFGSLALIRDMCELCLESCVPLA